MKFGNPKHARENQEHLALKKMSADAVLAGGADFVTFETGGCDVLAVKRTNGREYRMAIEVERSTRNVVRNLSRDMTSLNCGLVVIVAPSMQVKASIWAHLYKHLGNGDVRDIFVVCAGEFSDALFRGIFENWSAVPSPLKANLERRCPVSAD